MSAEIRAFRCLSDNIGALIHDPATGACAAVDAPEEAPIVKALEETDRQPQRGMKPFSRANTRLAAVQFAVHHAARL
jgi:hypothetical protein